MAKGKTTSGFKFDISERIATDWRLTLALADMDSKDESRSLQGVVSVVRLLLGDQEQAFYNHIAEADGHVDMQAVWDGVKEMLESLGKSQKKS